MLRYNLLMVSAAALAIAVVGSRDQVGAQSGQALAFAEHACLEYGVTPGTRTFEDCVANAAKAFDRGEPDLAYAEARVARAARVACDSPGKAPRTVNGSACADGLAKD
jgi:hypothetical protein